MAFGTKVMLALGPSFFFSTIASLAGDIVREGSTSGVVDLGVGVEEKSLLSFSSSLSTPNESFPFTAGFRFFFAGRLGVDALYFDH